MKTRIIFSLIALLIWPGSVLKSQQQPEQLNLPGDNLNLYAVMKIFQESETLELFEQKLNQEDARINNLDLNDDNFIDYIKVVDYVEKDVHYISLQVAVTPSENQDVAVFIIRKDPNGKVIIQLVGDEALYGKYYIVEPYYDTDNGTTPNPGYYGNNNVQQTVVIHHTTGYEVAAWPLVRFVFLPTYVAWHSPWYWNYYPAYWHPWTPWYWHEYYGYHYYWHNDYYGHYHHGHHNHYDNWHENYYGHHRTFSNTVIARRDRGAFNSSYTKPESIRDGAEFFKKQHPDMVTKDMKEPDVKNIKKADQTNFQGDRVKMVKPENTRGTVNTGKNQSNPNKVRTGNNVNQSEKVKQGQTGTKTEKVKPTRTENNATPVKPDRSQGVSKGEQKSTVKQAPKESNHPSREVTKKEAPRKEAPRKESPKKENTTKENSKTSKESGKPDRR